MAYYKYLTPARTDVLQHLKVRYTQVSALNDPFEYFPSVYSDEGNFEKEIEFQRKIRSITESTLGILCLSKTPANILMWSHYAASHAGFVVEFDSKHAYFKSGTEQVRYSHSRPRMSVRAGDQATTIFYTKSMDWRYEQEVRKVLPLHDRIHPLPGGHRLIEGDMKAGDNPSLIHLRELPQDLITGVILGWKSDEVLRQGVLNALRMNGMMSVPIMRAEPCKKEYRMRIFPNLALP